MTWGMGVIDLATNALPINELRKMLAGCVCSITRILLYYSLRQTSIEIPVKRVVTAVLEVLGRFPSPPGVRHVPRGVNRICIT